MFTKNKAFVLTTQGGISICADLHRPIHMTVPKIFMQKPKRNFGPSSKQKGRGQVKKKSSGAPRQRTEYGDQMISIMKKGYGRTLSDNPEMANFAHVYSDPFTRETSGLPIFPIVSSQKTYSTAQGSLVLNSNGIGWITYQPIWSVMTGVTTGWYSSGAGASDTVGAPGGTDTTSFQMKSQHTASAMTLGVGAVRITSSGMRVRYVGKEYDKAGVCYCAQLTQRNESSVGLSINDIRKQMGWKQYSLANSKWQTLTRHITSKTDEFFWSFTEDPGSDFVEEYNTNIKCPDLTANMVMILTGTPGQTFEFEVQTHYSLKGQDVFYRTVEEPRNNFVSHVVNAYSKLRNTDNTTKDHSSLGNVQASKTHAKETVWDSIKKGASSLFSVGKELIPFAASLLL